MGLRFVNCRRPQSDEALGSLERRQLREAGRLYDGCDLSAALRLAQGDAPGSFHGFVELWDVEDDDGLLRYHAWLYMGERGAVFRRGTTDLVAEVIQCSFHADDQVFAHRLEAAYRHAGR